GDGEEDRLAGVDGSEAGALEDEPNGNVEDRAWGDVAEVSGRLRVRGDEVGVTLQGVGKDGRSSVEQDRPREGGCACDAVVRHFSTSPRRSRPANGPVGGVRECRSPRDLCRWPYGGHWCRVAHTARTGARTHRPGSRRLCVAGTR